MLQTVTYFTFRIGLSLSVVIMLICSKYKINHTVDIITIEDTQQTVHSITEISNLIEIL